MAFISKHHKLLALLLFCAISILYFGLGLINHLNSLNSGEGADKYIYIWNLAWWPHALLHKLNPFIPTIVWAPKGINLAKLGSMPGLALLFMPITLIWSPVVTYNLLSIFSSAFAAWSAYLLCYYIIKTKPHALIGGYLFGYSCFMISQMLGHLLLVAPAFLIPLFPLLILKQLDHKISNFKFIILFTIALIFLFLISTEFFVTLTCWGGFSFLIAIACFREQRSQLISCIKPLFIAYLLTAIVISPYIYYFFTDTLTSFAVNPPWYYVNDLLEFITPSSVFLLSNHGTHQLSSMFTGNILEWNLYLGVGLILLFIIFVKQFWQSKVGKYLTIISLMLSVASLGPDLHIAGITVFHFPWGAFFTKTPILHAALPARLGLFASLAIAICAAIWVKDSPWALRYRILLLGISILFLLPSFNQLDRPTLSTTYSPPFFAIGLYKQYITPQDNVLIFPYQYSPQLYWQLQTDFKMKLAGGYLGTPPYLYKDDAVFNTLFNKIPSSLTKKQLTGFIYRHSITKIIIVNHYGYKKWKPLLVQIDNQPISVGGVTIYTVNKQQIYSTLFSCPTNFAFNHSPGKGWSIPEKQPSGIYYMWMDAKHATAKLMSSCRGHVMVKLHIPLAMSDDILNSLTMRLGDKVIPLKHISDRKNHIILEGKTNLKLPNNQPIDLTFSVSRTIKPPKDPRTLAIMFSEIQIYKYRKFDVK